MKNGKRIAAIVAIILLLAVFCLPMLFAIKGEFNMNYFFAALAAAFFVPLVILIMMEVHRIFVGSKKKEKREIENVIFDVGKVLVNFEWETLMNSFHFPATKRKRMVAAIFGSKIWDERDQGLYDDKDYVDRMVALEPEFEADIREFMRRTPETISMKDYELSWVKYLKSQGYNLYVLSNYGNYMLEANRPDMDFLDYMDGAVFSCEVKEIKPEKPIYQILMQRYHLDPKKSVFIDDRQENLDTAAELGMKTVLFKNFKQAVAELEKLGVK